MKSAPEHIYLKTCPVGYWKSTAAAAHDLILVEVDGNAHGKCQFLVEKLNKGQGGTLKIDNKRKFLRLLSKERKAEYGITGAHGQSGVC